MPSFRMLSRVFITIATLGTLFTAVGEAEACFPWEVCGPPGGEESCLGSNYECVEDFGPGPVWCRADLDLFSCRATVTSRTCCFLDQMCAYDNNGTRAYCTSTCPAGSTACGNFCCPGTSSCGDAATSTCASASHEPTEASSK